MNVSTKKREMLKPTKKLIYKLKRNIAVYLARINTRIMKATEKAEAEDKNLNKQD